MIREVRGKFDIYIKYQHIEYTLGTMHRVATLLGLVVFFFLLVIFIDILQDYVTDSATVAVLKNTG